MVAALVVTSAAGASLDEEIDRLTAEVSRHSASVHSLEQQLLHPVNTRVAVFLTLQNHQALDLDSVELFVNDQPVASHLYSATERASLEQGGVQQLFVGNMADGSHQLKTVINARAANRRFVRRELVHRFQKRPGTLRLQMTLDARAPDYEPEVTFVEWN
ncbi:AraC family transcriptional regulator [Marinobacter halophilus]|uniref:AraC family transcriptional regulator n=1 Tax=Marinobacter halophilus TaxID=1323740 RepID=A0A2T1K8U2_9GAMM|nr:AraC family transcriptional regulator [Marinobacter halophilus]PSF06438.1 AraC family transcriptional regulator [Marinobacter halophilus]GGC72623.1 hypothetical protein GCM10011362_21380 [Marinobacter halophilus]